MKEEKEMECVIFAVIFADGNLFWEMPGMDIFISGLSKNRSVFAICEAT